jgi:hypothetical protein
MKKETRGRKPAKIEPVKLCDGEWVRLVKAVERTGLHADTIRSLVKYKKIKRKTTDGVHFYFIKKQQDDKE